MPNAIEPEDVRPARTRFSSDLSRPVPIPPEAIRRAVQVLESGRLHRYGESRAGEGEVAAFEREFAALIGSRHALAVNSGGCALFLALKAVGVGPGDAVLTNAFTLAPVPGAIAHAGARPILVETTRTLTVDLDDLERKMARSGARTFLISHMRGHVADMDEVTRLCERHGVLMIEDCAHTLGATWNGTATGRFGHAACFSTHSYKHLNAGEGGVLTTDDPRLVARATILSGSYMFYGAHGAGPAAEHFAEARLMMPNCSMRMTELAAAILRPQLAHLPDWISSWNRSYRHLERRITGLPHLEVPPRAAAEGFVGSSLQFIACGLPAATMSRLLAEADAHGVHVQWFGSAEPIGYTSRHDSWRYTGPAAPMPRTDEILDGLCDLRVPVGLSPADCDLIGDVLGEAMTAALAAS
ncbi:MAG: DegT/DnrJ/EryC1/StrS family aminotransferase [Geminicoccaceae bacterium]|nr:DegT/DnrJ/EryC1/StrS family aminotransferase [Geminicoccaceae bacterium]